MKAFVWMVGVVLACWATAQPAGAQTAPTADKAWFCPSNPPIVSRGSDWANVGFDANSTRFQPHPGLEAADVPKLKLKWSFSVAASGMPVVVGDWLFISSMKGQLYALDAKTGCTHWVLANAPSRTTPRVFRSTLSPSGWALVIGDRRTSLRTLDAQTGQLLWRSERLETHPAAQMTGAPALADGRLYAPMSSFEFNTALQAKYPCCSFRGSLSAVDLATGAILWKTPTIREPLTPTRLNSAGVQMQGPAGASIWSTPTTDPRRGLVYVGTGNSYSDAPTAGSVDSIVALEMSTGAIRWSHRFTETDNFISGCPRAVKPANCPSPSGPDFDFGASPILFNLGRGKDILLAGQKSGVVFGIDPDTGRTLWTRRVGAGSEFGGVHWGMAADGQRLYVANADLVNLVDEALRPQGIPRRRVPLPKGEPGLTALDPATGKVLWHVPAPIAPCHYEGDRRGDSAKGACIRAQGAAPSVMPGVVFSGTVDGWFRAYDAATGEVIWANSTTAQTYDTVNGLLGQPGGSLDGLGAAVAGGMVYTMSGYDGANVGGNVLNVLLAFSVDGR